MNARTLFIGCLTGLLLPLSTFGQGAEEARELLMQMTLREKAEMVIGHLSAMQKVNPMNPDALRELDFTYPGLGMPIGGCPRLGLPVTICSDGSYGLKRYMPMADGKYHTTVFPSPFSNASTWNTHLLQQLSAAYAREGREAGVQVLLGPGMNIMRDPLCGRNFEYYSEDPLLTGSMGAAVVSGIQSQGLAATPKHFAANSQETDRVVNDSRVSERALREIYLKGFERMIQQAAPVFVMTSYNKINGRYTSEDRHLLQDIVRGEWGFKGCFMTDFGGLGWSPDQIAAGNDLVMPGSSYHVQNIVHAVETGQLSQADLDACVSRLIRANQWIAQKQTRVPGGQQTESDRQCLAREAATEGFVLLKNDQMLPMDSKDEVAFFGIGSYYTAISGIGSGRINADYRVNIADGMASQQCAAVAKFYQSRLKAFRDSLPPPSGLAAIMGSDDPVVPEWLPSVELIEQSARETTAAVVTIKRCAGEGYDRKAVEGDWLLTQEERWLLNRVAQAFHSQGKKMTVILNVAGLVEMASWRDRADAIMLVWLPGQEGGNAVADVLTGRISPSGRLTATLPLRYEDVPSYGHFPTGVEKSIDVTENGFQVENVQNPVVAVFENGKKRRHDKPDSLQVENLDYTCFTEDVFVGYRHYDTQQSDVAYPFGYGLSYTTFAYDVEGLVADHTVSVTVTNTGRFAGKEVVQLYMVPPSESIKRPAHELVAFAKTHLLQPGESETLRLQYDSRDLCYYDESRGEWVKEDGLHRLQVAQSSRDVIKTIDIP